MNSSKNDFKRQDASETSNTTRMSKSNESTFIHQAPGISNRRHHYIKNIIKNTLIHDYHKYTLIHELKKAPSKQSSSDHG